MYKLFYIAVFLCYSFIFGSFFTCLISRYHVKQENLKRYSCCPHCHHRLFYHDMIPVLSWIFLKGRCRYCNNKISIRYPLIELSFAISFMLAYLADGFTLILISDCMVISALIILSWIDIDYMIIPTGSILLILCSSIILLYNQTNLLLTRFIQATIFSLILFIFAFFSKALGYGDIKLIGISILYLGLERMIAALIISCIIASTIELFKIIFLDKKIPVKIPFGPYLSIGIFLIMLYYEQIIQAYLQLIGL